MRRALLVSIGVVLLLLVPLGISEWSGSISAADTAGIAAEIEKQNGAGAVTVLGQCEKEDFLAVRFEKEGREEKQLAVFRKNLLGRFKFFGTGSGSMEVNTYSYSERGERTLVVVYGDNPGATSYQLTVGGRYYGNEELGERILDLYLIEGVGDMGGSLTLFDAEGTAFIK